ncbi:MAG: cyclic nucleotide-binding/CBS domain-containing protein [bacterium]
MHVDFDQFDDELQSMRELMDEGHIALRETNLRVTIDSLNLKKAVVVNIGTTMRKCIDTMAARHFGCLLIVDGDKLVGIFTERDALLRIAGQGYDLEKEKIDEFMTRDPTSMKVSDTIEKALRLMNDGGYRHVAVVDDTGRPVSVLSVKDIISYIIEFFPQDVLNLPPHPIRVGTRHRHGA